MENDFTNKVISKENEISSNMEKNALLVLDSAIIEMSRIENDSLIIFPAMHLQIAVELFIKDYICRVYGFECILTSKFKKMRQKNIKQYLNELRYCTIKTLGFNELKDFLKEKKDYFGFVIKEGKSYLYNLEIEYDYLEGLFDEFQNIRNNFLHLGIGLKEEDIRWIKSDFYTITIYFLSTIFDRNKKVYNYEEVNYVDFYITSIDILMSKLSNEARLALKDDKNFEGELESIAEDISETKETFRCTNCGKDTLALNIINSGGQTKCLYCGLCIDAYYCECAICKDDTIIFDGLNIKPNNNIMPGYCYRCEKKLKVYKCPSCGNVYSYDSKHPIDFKLKCCESNFKDRQVCEVDYD